MPDPIPTNQAIPLARLQGMTPSRVDAVKDLWITTVQDLMALAELPGGRQHLQSLLGMSDSAFDGLLNRARGMIPRAGDDAQKQLDEAMDMDYGTGAIELPQERAGEEYDSIAFAGKLPSTVDYTGNLPPARNQGSRGTCVAHAAAAVREHMEIHVGAAGADEINLSEQFIYWWCKEKDNLPHVSGTYPHLGMECLAEIGTADETIWPYNARPRVGDEGQGPPPDPALEQAWRYRVKRVIELNAKRVESIKMALADGKAIVFAIPVFDSWYRNKVTRQFGKIGMPLPGEKKNGAHAMAIVGYEDDEDAPGGGYFLIRNSWSPWGFDNPRGDGFGAIPYAFIAQHNMSATTGDRSSLSDVYIRDNEDDQGEVPSEGARYNSPDIWVRHSNDNEESHQALREGQENWIYVRAWNLGPAEAKAVKATLYHAPASPSIWPDNWQAVGEVRLDDIPVNGSAVGALAWTPPDDGNYCFLARLSSPDDPIQHEWSVRNDNNLAQKNLIILPVRPGKKGEFSFRMHGLPNQVTMMDLKVNRRAFPRGRVTLKMAERQRLRGRFDLVEDEAKLAELAVRATDSEDVGVVITADERSQPGDSGEIIFTQHKGRLLVGRLVVRVEIV